MCSIGGFFSEKMLPPDVARCLAEGLIYYGAQRGQQSAGCYVHGVGVAKRAVNPAEFIDDPSFVELFKNGASLVLTHTRAPTSGGRDDEHAQPFVVGNTVGVHNGMIHDSLAAAKRHGVTKASGVDSELFPAFVDTHGPAKLPDLMSDIHHNSAIAIVHDSRLYLARHSNPLEYEYIITKSFGRIFAFASTGLILQKALRYLWLMPESMNGRILPENQLFNPDFNELHPIGDKFAGKQYNTYNGGHYGSNGGGRNGCAMGGQQDFQTGNRSSKKGGRKDQTQISREFWDRDLEKEGWTKTSNGGWRAPSNPRQTKR